MVADRLGRGGGIVILPRAAAPARSAVRWIRSYPAVPLRRAQSQGRAGWTRVIPRFVARRLDLVGEVVRPLRLELGCGPFPSPGYVHMDLDRSARHLEHVGPVWDLPFEDGEVAEILAIHVLEHVHPSQLRRTLHEWLRVLTPGGYAQIHVPNAPDLFDAFERAPIGEKWALVNALLGMYGSAEIAAPEDIEERFRSDHQAFYDFALLEAVLLDAGFGAVENLTGVISDRHCEAWRGLVKEFSLIVRAGKAPARG